MHAPTRARCSTRWLLWVLSTRGLEHVVECLLHPFSLNEFARFFLIVSVFYYLFCGATLSCCCYHIARERFLCLACFVAYFSSCLDIFSWLFSFFACRATAVGVRRKRNPPGLQHHPHTAGRVSRGAAPQAKREARPPEIALPRAGDRQELPGN